MHDEDQYDHHKGPAEVLTEYLAADSPEDWLIHEVCSYLFQELPAGELDERLNSFDEMIAAERERMLDNGPELDDVILYTVTVVHDEETEEFLSFRSCPSPALLLEACVHMAEPGDPVRVDMVYGDASRSTATLVWPFPMHVAVEVTTAMRREVDESDLAFYEFVEGHLDDDGSYGDDLDDELDAEITAELDDECKAESAVTEVPRPRVKPAPTVNEETSDRLVLGLAVGAAAGMLAGLAAARRLLSALR